MSAAMNVLFISIRHIAMNENIISMSCNSAMIHARPLDSWNLIPI